MGDGNVAVMSLPPLRGHEGLMPLQHRLARPRCLFGRPDPLYLKDAMNQISQENKLRWNFDFENEQPMVGRYKWEKVGPAGRTVKYEDVENASAADAEDAPKNDVENTANSDLKDALQTDAESTSKARDAVGEENSTKSVNVEPKTRQTHITDFMRKRKSSNQKIIASASPPKILRRSST